MEWTTFINPVITVVTSGFIIKILSQQISSQKDQINNMKTIVDAMKAQMETIKIDELEKYYERKTANAVANAIENIDEHVLEETQNLLRHDIKTLKLTAEAWENDAMMSKYTELVVGLARIIKKVPREKRYAFLERHFPQNAELLWPIIEKSIA